MKSTKRNH